MLTLIVARARNGAIGKSNRIPWHIPADLKMFQCETLGGALIMGRRTWHSLPVKPLKNRLNIVLSRQADLTDHVFTTASEAIGFCRSQGYHRIYGIGGQAVYQELLPKADRLMLTEVDIEIPDADAFFPDFDKSDWTEITRVPIPDTDPRCTLRELIRR